MNYSHQQQVNKRHNQSYSYQQQEEQDSNYENISKDVLLIKCKATIEELTDEMSQLTKEKVQITERELTRKELEEKVAILEKTNQEIFDTQQNQQNNTIKELQQNQEVYKTLSKQFENANSYSNTLKAENEELKKKLNDFQKQSEECNPNKQDFEKLKNDSLSYFEQMTQMLKSKDDKISSLEKQDQELKEKIKSLEQSIDSKKQKIQSYKKKRSETTDGEDTNDTKTLKLQLKNKSLELINLQNIMKEQHNLLKNYEKIIKENGKELEQKDEVICDLESRDLELKQTQRSQMESKVNSIGKVQGALKREGRSFSYQQIPKNTIINASSNQYTGVSNNSSTRSSQQRQIVESIEDFKQQLDCLEKQVQKNRNNTNKENYNSTNTAHLISNRTMSRSNLFSKGSTMFRQPSYSQLTNRMTYRDNISAQNGSYTLRSNKQCGI